MGERELPPEPEPGEPELVTNLLLAWREGDAGAFERLMTVLYGDLRRLAAWQLGQRAAGNTLQPTAVVHEAFLRLVQRHRVDFRGGAHFLAAAAQAMRHVLVDHARAKAAMKRGGRAPSVTLVEADAGGGERPIAILAVDEALERLAALDADKARVVELRYFGGLTVEETAEVLAVSPATVKRSWSFAKAWLARELGQAAGGA